MVRMRDVLRSARDVVRTERTDPEKPEQGGGGFAFPAPKGAPVPGGASSSLNQPAPEEEKKEKPDSSPKTDLYFDVIKTVDDFLTVVRDGEPFHLDDIEKKATEMAHSLQEGDHLFMKGLSSRRSQKEMPEHSVNVAIVAIKVAFGLRLPFNKVVEAGIAALVHEVGMLRVPQEVLTKKGELTPMEFQMIKQHPLHGKAILEEIADEHPFLAEVVSQEHERWNGNGYPMGLKEDQIHLYAQIIGIADTFVALTHHRHYKDNFIAYKAIQSIIERRNKDFSARLIKSLIDVISIFPVDSLVKLNDGNVARVTKTNKAYPVRPVIKVVRNSQGEEIDGKIMDLSQEPMIYIVSPVLDEDAYA